MKEGKKEGRKEGRKEVTNSDCGCTSFGQKVSLSRNTSGKLIASSSSST